MKVRTLLCVCALLFSLTVAAQFQPERYPKREFRAAWIQAVNGQFRGIPTEKLKQTLIGQLNSLQEAGINAIIFQVRPEADALSYQQHPVSEKSLPHYLTRSYKPLEHPL